MQSNSTDLPNLNVQESLLHYLRCPDDHSGLLSRSSGFVCGDCGREFIGSGRATFDVRPTNPCPLPTERNAPYVDSYNKSFKQTLSSGENGLGWGADEKTPAPWIEKRKRQVRYVEPIVLKSIRRKTLCDVSAGAGRYTLEFAKYFDIVFHCDISPDSVFYVSKKAETLGLGNIVFLRTDYLKLPFTGSLDVVICFDSLSRGEKHERLLLNSIKSSLAPGGIAVVDFHNWWHNPVRRLGILKENYGQNISYARREVESLLHDSEIHDFNYFPFVQECSADHPLNWIIQKVIPATRLIYALTKPM